MESSGGPLALLFPGQGAQVIGMGRWLLDSFPAACERFAEASEILGYDLVELCLRGPAERLEATVHSQPALFVTSVAAAEVLRAERGDWVSRVRAVAGLSLGEYSAIAFAGGFTFEDGLRLVKQRGEAMQAASDLVPSGMSSVIGLPYERVVEVCDEARVEGEILQPANLLCPGNIAVSGHRRSLDRLTEIAHEAGATKVIPLPVAGAFHTALMQPAAQSLSLALSSVSLAELSLPLYSNVDAEKHLDSSDLPQLLARQLVSPVRWEASIRQMIDDGIEGFVEVGTGRVLRGTIKRIARKLPAEGFGDGE